MSAVTIPADYQYVLLAATSTFFVNTVHAFLTSSRRKAAGVKYPITYATEEQAAKDPKAFAFNCGMPPLPPRSTMKRARRLTAYQPNAPTPTSPRT
jgi:hypothetical protein